ncbi:MAG: hypothetical protein IPH81_09030 [Candidatus Microthrix sp.]|nr:hypothetical protein [Candidatus Microthrix sp.]
MDVGAWTTLGGSGGVDAILGPLTFGYKGGVGDHFGYAALMGFAGLSVGLGAITTAFRDGDAEAIVQVEASDQAFADQPPMGVVPWPALFAIGIGIAVVGLSFSPFLFGLGLFVAVLVGAEWTLTVWSERTSSDPEVNRAVRGRVIWPLEVPVGVAAGLAVIVFSMSRLFLATAGLGAAIIAGALALIVLTMAFVLSARPSINRGLVLAVVLVFGVIVIGAGIWGGVADNNKDHNTEEGAASSTAAPGGQTVGSLLYPSASAASAAAS